MSEPNERPAEDEGPAPEGDRPEGSSNFLLDFGPLLVFVVAYKLKGIYWATGCFMVAAPIALVVTWLRDRKLRPLPIVTAAIVLVFGGLTLWFADPRFIYIKPTIVTSLTAFALLGGLAFKRPLLKPLLGSALTLNDEGWTKLSLRFALFSLFVAGLNEAVWRTFTPDAEHVWVWFKFLGIPALTMVFMLAHSSMIRAGAEPSPRQGD